MRRGSVRTKPEPSDTGSDKADGRRRSRRSLACHYCGCCSSRLLAGSVVGSLVLCREAAIAAVLAEDSGFVRSLQPIRRVRLAELDLDDYHRNHVLRAVPLIVELPVGDGEKLWDDEATLGACGTASITLLSRATRQTLRSIRGTPLESALGLALRLFSAEAGGFDGFLRARESLPLSQLAARLDAAAREAEAAAATRPWWARWARWASPSAPPRGLIWPVALLSRLSPTAAMLDAVLRVVLGPPYLYDVPVDAVCAELEAAPDGAVWRAYERQAPLVNASWLRATLDAHTAPLHTLSTAEDSRLLFWGAEGATAYPMHRDIIDADNVMQVLSGCKEAVVLWESEAMVTGAILSSQLPGTTAYAFNPFNAPAADAATVGWHGVYGAGDVLLLPGNSLHHVRNRCSHSVAVNVRPWRHSASREAAFLEDVPIPFSTRQWPLSEPTQREMMRRLSKLR